MEIIVKEKRLKLKFSDVKEGELFLDENDCLCVKQDPYSMSIIADSTGFVHVYTYDCDDYDCDTEGLDISNMPVKKIFKERIIESITLKEA